ncbi:gamma-tubulin complex, DGRIP91/SPC98 component [Cantharellus anzutake]|uniref:gamma-tubulin complex, DGRIP91/SPC98 component n=1 Tax=Cantharellus anzutake TaxID=1750568 RepID=UPI00190639BB|nr:gamma-tubulin complex, DGRIP91/SPC98 component [Cantharellus anzutake]KAF8325167.1 gamma-tubulin complex, DGRIP91/SPC98 component [Cantharellus anzutake]
MPSLTTSLATLVQSIDAVSRENPRRRMELIEDCEAILNSHISENKDADIGSIAASVKRQLLQHPGGSNSTLRFSNLLARLLEQASNSPILTRKHSVLLFLQALSTPVSSITSPIASYLPSLAPPKINGRASPLPDPSPSARVSSPTLVIAPPKSRPKPKTKAEILREWRAQHGKPHLPEHLLLRDALYLIQGISGKYVRFSHNSSSSGDQESKIVFVDDPEYIVSPPTQALVHKLSEIGHLYTRVARFVKERAGMSSIGMIEQSLSHHLQAQLTEYYKLVAILESQMTHQEDVDESRTEDSGLSLRRLDVWIDDWRLRMRMMSVCVENCRGAKGGALVSLIHGNTNNGDPFVRSFTDQLLEEVSKPFFQTLQRWITTGELHDPYEEFFVAAHPDLVDLTYVHPNVLSADEGLGNAPPGAVGKKANGEEVGSLKLWESKFVFRREMLPSFVSEEFGRKIFSTGKSLNFIRYSCQDGDWVAAQGNLAKAGTLKYSDISGLERSIDAAYHAASRRIHEIFFQRYKLLDHLLAIKSYLMLGYGDFVDQLMESLGPSLDHAANTLYRHNLTATLETAIRYTSASQDSTDVLRRLDARILDYQHGEIGWDVFTLEYKVDAPIDTVLGEESMIQYARLFNHLWQMKRVEGALVQEWARVTGGARTFLKVPEHARDWHQVRIVMAEMNHFIRQLTAYSHMEIIAIRWKALMDFLQKKEGDLDALIDAHQTYLDTIVRKVLLLHPKNGKEENVLTQIREIFSIILNFEKAVQSFYMHTLAESTRRDSEKDTQRGVITTLLRPSNSEIITQPSSPLPQPNLPSAPSPPLDLTLVRLREYGTAFSERVTTIVFALGNHPDQDCRYLAVKLSFSDFYRVKAKEKAEKADKEAQQLVVGVAGGGKEAPNAAGRRPSHASSITS